MAIGGSNLKGIYTSDIPGDLSCQIRDLTVTYRLERGDFPAINNVNLNVVKGKITALIGESGSGKTTLGLAMMNGIADPGRITNGSVKYAGHGDILTKTREELRAMRGRHVGMVFQAAQNSLNPLKRVGSIILDLARSHGYNPKVLLNEAAKLAKRMSLDSDRVLTSYQHELSGGMKQRVNIILSLVLSPNVLILDEPTTALDVLSQAAVLQIVRDVQNERQLTTILITHDLSVVAELADQVCVMYSGKIVEQGVTKDILINPKHPYTRALIRAIPKLTGDKSESKPLKGSAPDLTGIPSEGCIFQNRCEFVMNKCCSGDPERHIIPNGHEFVCNLEDDSDD